MDEGLVWLIVVVIPLIVVIGIALFHVVARRPDLGLLGKAGWITAIVFLPYIGVLLYALFRPPGVAPGKETADDAATGTTMRRLRGLVDEHASGAVDDEAFATAKAELFGL